MNVRARGCFDTRPWCRGIYSGLRGALVWGCLVWVLASGLPAGAAPAMTIDLNMAGGRIEIRYLGKPLMVYSFAAGQPKPYVRELYSLGGANVLRDAPPAFPHYHGLMYGAGVNGTNFWDDRAPAGVQHSVQILSYSTGLNEEKMPQAQFIQVIYWVAERPRGEVPEKSILLAEQRTLTLSVNEPSQEVALRWDADFEVGRKTRKATLHGPEDCGLGLCLAESFKGAQFDNSAAQPYTGDGAQTVAGAKWTSVSGAVDGQGLTLALFAHPKNPPGQAGFFTMRDPVACVSVTQDLAKKPLEYASRARFQLHYLLTIHSEGKPREFIQQRSDRWQSTQR